MCVCWFYSPVVSKCDQFNNLHQDEPRGFRCHFLESFAIHWNCARGNKYEGIEENRPWPWLKITQNIVMERRHHCSPQTTPPDTVCKGQFQFFYVSSLRKSLQCNQIISFFVIFYVVELYVICCNKYNVYCYFTAVILLLLVWTMIESLIGWSGDQTVATRPISIRSAKGRKSETHGKGWKQRVGRKKMNVDAKEKKIGRRKQRVERN